MGGNPYRKDVDDGFFDDIQTEEEKQEEQPVSKNPYKAHGTEKEGGRYENAPQKPKSKMRNFWIGLLLAVVVFISGGLTTWFSLDKETRSFLKVKFLIENLYYEDLDEEEIYDVVFDAINKNLLDPYSRYYTADEYEEVLQSYTGSRSGLGLSFLVEKKEETEKLKVLLVAGNSPAERAGVKINSYLTGYGRTQTDILPCESFDDFKLFLSGFNSGEPFYVQFTQGEASEVLQITKEEFIENYVFYRSSQTAYRFTGEKATTLTEGGEIIPSLEEDTAYIRLTQFNGNAGEQFDKAMKVFKEEGKTNLVLDLRYNGGGDMEVLKEIAKYFCKTSAERQPLVTEAVYKNWTEGYYAPKNLYKEYFTQESQIYVLADNGTASASEALMGCMLDYGATSYQNICLSERASESVAGVRESKTYGKGIMQMTLPLLFGKDALKITVAKIVWPTSGNCIHDRGILPSDGTKTVAEYENDDMEIQEAIKQFIK